MTSVPPTSPTAEVPYEERVQLAVAAWRNANGALSMRKAARQHGVSKSTLDYRIHGHMTVTARNQKQQKLTPEEESALVTWILRLQAWGWPPRVEQTRQMAVELLLRKGDTRPLGVNWAQKFFARHPEIKTLYTPPPPKERAKGQDPTILDSWFKLYWNVKTSYNIELEDTYNMDEKAFLQGVIAKLKIMISKYEKKAHMAQPGNHEWVSLVECVSMDGRVLKPWVIFKGRQQQKAWWDVLREGHIALSENGWTGNELSLEWIKNCFDPETKAAQKGEYRLLIVDGHASHITTQAVEYCEAQKIIVLCLPPRTTRLLQPLDVGIFAPLADAYKARVQQATHIGAGYSIDKTDFLQLYQMARMDAMTTGNIQNAWAKAGLSPYNPNQVLCNFENTDYNIAIRPTAPQVYLS